MLDISAYNAFVIFTEINTEWNKNKKIKSRLFLEELGNELILQEISRRSVLPRSSAAKMIVINTRKTAETTEKAPKPTNLKRGRCFICPSRSNSTKYSRKCGSCENFICKTHSEISILCTSSLKSP